MTQHLFSLYFIYFINSFNLIKQEHGDKLTVLIPQLLLGRALLIIPAQNSYYFKTSV